MVRNGAEVVTETTEELEAVWEGLYTAGHLHEPGAIGNM